MTLEQFKKLGCEKQNILIDKFKMLFKIKGFPTDKLLVLRFILKYVNYKEEPTWWNRIIHKLDEETNRRR